MRGKLGRAAPIYTARALSSAACLNYHLAKLGSPPSATKDRVTVLGPDIGMLGNQMYGCCVEADAGHTLMLRSAAAGKPVVPTETDVLALYTAITGFDPMKPETDIGTSELMAMVYLTGAGFMGSKIINYGNIDPANHDNLRWSVELFGSCRFGINLPRSAGDQFDAGEPWDIVDNDGGIEGRHDVALVHADENHFYVATWGRVQLVTPAFVTKYLEESHAEFWDDWPDTVSGFDRTALISDLNSLSQGALI